MRLDNIWPNLGTACTQLRKSYLDSDDSSTANRVRVRTPNPLTTVHQFPILCPKSGSKPKAKAHRPTHDVINQPTNQPHHNQGHHRGSGPNGQPQSDSSIAGYRPMLLFSPAWHRPVRRVSPPLREGRRSVSTGRMTAKPVIPCPTNPTSFPRKREPRGVPNRRSRVGGNPGAKGRARSARGSLGRNIRNQRSGRSADSLNLTTLAPQNQPTKPTSQPANQPTRSRAIPKPTNQRRTEPPSARAGNRPRTATLPNPLRRQLDDNAVGRL